MFDFNSWIRQPSTIHGLGVAAAGIGVALSQVATGNPTIDSVVAVVVYVLVHLGVDDHSAAEQAITHVVGDAIKLAPLGPEHQPVTVAQMGQFMGDLQQALSTNAALVPAQAPAAPAAAG